RIEPADATGQGAQHLNQRPADMAGAEQRDVEQVRPLRFEQQRDMPAAALPQRGPERKLAQARPLFAAQHVAGDLDGAEFERAAPDAADAGLGRHHHLGPGLARRRTVDGGNRDQHGGNAALFQIRQRIQPAAHFAATASGAAASLRFAASMASSTRSGVAGASRWTRCVPAAAATASLSASQPEIASISGGSPTAFERKIVSAGLGLPLTSLTRKSAGRSRAAGTL